MKKLLWTTLLYISCALVIPSMLALIFMNNKIPGAVVFILSYVVLISDSESYNPKLKLRKKL